MLIVSIVSICVFSLFFIESNAFFDNNVSGIKYIDLALKRCSNDDDFSIHGWWPEYNKTSYPQWCNVTLCKQFDYRKLSVLSDKLNKYWYSCDDWNINTETLLKHEWCKHATCISSNENFIDYFNRTLSIYLDARSHVWYGCCEYHQKECLIPYDVNGTKWLGWCNRFIK